MARSTDVDAWFAVRKLPHEAAMQRVREIILAADPRVTESVKWQTPTFAYKGNIVSFQPAKKMVSLLFHRGGEIPGDHPQLLGDSRLARVMHFAGLSEVEAGRSGLEAVIRAWCAWRDTAGT